MSSSNAEMSGHQGNHEKNGPTPRFVPNDFKIEPIMEKDHEKIMDFLRKYFLPREQICLGLHLDLDEYIAYYSKSSKPHIYSGASVCVIYSPTSELAAVMLNQFLTRDSPHVFMNKTPHNCSQSVKNTIGLLAHMESSFDLFADPKVNKVMEIAVTTVAPKFTGNKLAFRMAEVAEKRALELGCQVAVSQSTSVITQHIRKKMGFEECSSLDYETFEIDGERVMDMSAVDKGNLTAKLLRKYLVKN